MSAGAPHHVVIEIVRCEGAACVCVFVHGRDGIDHGNQTSIDVFPLMAPLIVFLRQRRRSSPTPPLSSAIVISVVAIDSESISSPQNPPTMSQAAPEV